MVEVALLVEKIEKIKMIYRVLILAGTLAVLGGIFISLVYIPKMEQIEKVSKEINGLRLKINQAKIKTRDLAKFEAEEAEVDAQFQMALELLPKEREIPSLLRNITQLGIDSNLEFHLFSPKKEIPRDFYIEIPVSIQVTGRYHDVAIFFDKVGRMKRIVNILGVSMRPAGGDSAELNTQCTAVTYRFKEKTGERKGKRKKK
ncbi:MAG: type 4a pilus biogenesis protein PilO [Thermodesulfobacteriota bacterium]|nr:type 4a pilus biogenesis protein PilO [Thermodesulfobacteriota bacterium]